jgi:hypothetical protein
LQQLKLCGLLCQRIRVYLGKHHRARGDVKDIAAEARGDDGRTAFGARRPGARLGADRAAVSAADDAEEDEQALARALTAAAAAASASARARHRVVRDMGSFMSHRLTAISVQVNIYDQ